MPKKLDALSRNKRLVNAFWPGKMSLVDRINRVPAFVEYVKKDPQVPVFQDRIDMYKSVFDMIGPAPIDYLEFGVHQGESIRNWMGLNANPQSRFTGFDSFEGLPESWAGLEAGHFTTGGHIPVLNDARVSFVRGWFQDTLDGFLKDYKPRHRLVINNDSDLYSSTLYVLTKLDHFMIPGTIIFFDEFDDVQHEFRAMQDYSSAYRKKFRPLAACARFRTVALEVL